MNDSKALFYLSPFSPAAQTAVGYPENARYQADAEKITHVQADEQKLLRACELEAQESSTEALTREGTPNARSVTYRDMVLRFGFDDMEEAGGLVFGRDIRSHVLLARPDDSDNYGISRVHFRIHLNLDNGMLMLTDTSTYGTFVQGVRMKRETTPLTTDTTILCGQDKRLCFYLQLQDYTGNEDDFRRNFSSYVAQLGCHRSLYLPSPGTTPNRRNVGTEYTIVDTVGKGNFGAVYTVMHRKTERLYAAKEITTVKNNNNRTIVPMEVAIFSKVLHVSSPFGRGNVFS